MDLEKCIVNGLVRVFYELFHLPTAEQCTEWWRRNAAHLGALRGEGMRGLFDLVRTGSHAHLGRASVGLSFRGLESVADTVSLQDATKADAKSPADCPLEPAMHDIKKDIGGQTGRACRVKREVDGGCEVRSRSAVGRPLSTVQMLGSTRLLVNIHDECTDPYKSKMIRMR